MKFSLNTFQQFWSSLSRGYHGQVNPERDWYILILIGCGLMLASVLVNLIIFFDVYRGAPISAETSENPPARETQQTEERLKEVESIFETRARVFEETLTQPYEFVDPARN